MKYPVNMVCINTAALWTQTVNTMLYYTPLNFLSRGGGVGLKCQGGGEGRDVKVSCQRERVLLNQQKQWCLEYL